MMGRAAIVTFEDFVFINVKQVMDSIEDTIILVVMLSVSVPDSKVSNIMLR